MNSYTQTISAVWEEGHTHWHSRTVTGWQGCLWPLVSPPDPGRLDLGAQLASGAEGVREPGPQCLGGSVGLCIADMEAALLSLCCLDRVPGIAWAALDSPSHQVARPALGTWHGLFPHLPQGAAHMGTLEGDQSLARSMVQALSSEDATHSTIPT